MSKRIYVDSNIYIDYFENRSDKYRDFGEEANRLFERTLSCEFKIIVSDTVMYELSKLKFKEDFEIFMKKFKTNNKIEFINLNNILKKEAKKMQISHYDDRLHYLLAKKAKVNFIVTRNWKDFYDFKDVEVFPPEFI